MNRIKINIQKPCPTKKDEFAEIDLSMEQDNTYKLKVDNTFFYELYGYTRETSSIAFEFYLFSIVIYNIDKLIPRKKFSLDGWSREIEFEYAVKDLSVWASINQKINKMLSFLTGDVWNVSFVEDDSNSYYIPLDEVHNNSFTPDRICLFSGGLDSLVGSYELLTNEEKPLLVSHYDIAMSSPNSDQNKIIEQLKTRFNLNTDFDWVNNRVGAIKGSKDLVSLRLHTLSA